MSISVQTHTQGHVGIIHFAKPPLNYACPELLRQIADAIDSFDADDQVRVMLLQSEGKAFCAGADLAGDDAIAGDKGMDAIADLYVQAHRLFTRKKPMIAVLHGAAIGAGLGLALTADFRIAGPACRLSANFSRLGFHPGFALTYSLPRLIGVQRASWMMLSSDRIKPDTALQWGLIDRIAAAESLPEEAMAMAEAVAANAPLALTAIRATLTNGLGDAVQAAMRHEHHQQTLLFSTADYAEGVASVFERRDAHFMGR